MKKLQLVMLFIVIAVFGVIFWFTQKDSLSKPDDALTGILPTISTEPGNITPIASPTPAPPPVVQGPVKEDIRASISAQIKTTKGTIYITLYNDAAKFSVKNFTTKANAGFYKNLSFHRVEDWVIQGGDPSGNGTGGGATQTELTGKPFVAGSIGYAASSNMAISVEQRARISNDAQFFIVKSDAPWLDTTYTNFGEVTSGMSVVKKIEIGDKILDIIIDKE